MNKRTIDTIKIIISTIEYIVNSIVSKALKLMLLKPTNSRFLYSWSSSVYFDLYVYRDGSSIMIPSHKDKDNRDVVLGPIVKTWLNFNCKYIDSKGEL